MNNSNTTVREQARTSISNKVLKNTYILLSMTLLFSAFTAFVSYAINISIVNPFITLGLYFVTLYLTTKNKNNASGIFWVFCLTGILGFTLGPILNIYMNNLSNGTEIVATALMLTGTIFLSLSAYVNYTKKDFSFMGGFVTSGIILAFTASIILLISSKNLAIGYLNEPNKQSIDARNSKKDLIKFPWSINSKPFRQAYTDTPKKDIVLIQSP